ncbi:MAG: hypothetical protein ACE5KM_10020 [Planctomycetaceae bacterium]
MHREFIGIVGLTALIANLGVGTARECRAAGAVRRNDDPLLKQVRLAIETTTKRYLTAGVHTPWQIMHGILAYRGDYEIRDATGKRRIDAVAWMSNGPQHNRRDWFLKTRYGARPHPYTTDYIFEGHPNQFLAMMAMAGFPRDHKLKAGKTTITVQDLVNHAKKEITTQDEVTWSLWALSHYLGPDATWTNKYGESWSVEYLASRQTQSPAVKGACGGTHGLFALAFARKAYLKTGRPLRGVWLQADVRIKRHVEIARSLQNGDGSFSSQYFQGRGYSRNFETRLSTSGHMLEFLALSVTDGQLKEDWFRKGVAAVAKDLIDNKYKAAEPGALYHALDGLMIYRQRVTGIAPALVSRRLPVQARRPAEAGSRWRRTADRRAK